MEELRPELAVYVAERFPRARLRRLAGDASTRRFYRVLLLEGGSRVLMDYGAPFEGEPDDVVSERIFREAGLRVAAIEAIAPGAGCLVLEDLGDRTLEKTIGKLPRRTRHDKTEEFYRTAVKMAADIAGAGTRALRRSPRATGPALDAERFRFEMDFFVEHHARGLLGRSSAPHDLIGALHELADRAADSPRVLCHRDFHSRNIMVLADGSLAMVDIQDARWGPDVYDLASLLRDAYVDIEEELVISMVEVYRASRPDPPDPVPYRARFDLVAIQRMIKAVGTFAYQIHARGNRRYGDALARTLRRLERHLPANPALEALAGVFDREGLFKLPESVHPESGGA